MNGCSKQVGRQDRIGWHHSPAGGRHRHDCLSLYRLCGATVHSHHKRQPYRHQPQPERILRTGRAGRPYGTPLVTKINSS